MFSTEYKVYVKLTVVNGLRTIFRSVSTSKHTGELSTLLIRYLLVYLTQIIVLPFLIGNAI